MTPVPVPSQSFRALSVATLGGMLEYFEFIIFVYLAAQLGAHFFPAHLPEWLRLLQTFSILAAGFLVRAVGGILLAQVGDRLGRKRIFSLSLLCMAIPTLVIGLLPGHDQIGLWAPLLLLGCRLVQGLSLGGELPGALCFVSEQVSERQLPLALGVLAASLALGALAGSLAVTGLSHWLGRDAMYEYGWRIPFIAGGLFGLLSVYLRRFTRETPVFRHMQSQALVDRRAPLATLLTSHRRHLMLGMMLAAVGAVLTGAIQQFPLTFLTMFRGLDDVLASRLQSLLILYGMLGNVAVGALVSMTRLPLMRTFQACLLLAMAGLVMLYLSCTPWLLHGASLLAGLSAGGAMALMLSLLVQSFPAPQRYTGLATSYNLPIAAIGGSLLLIMTALSRLAPGLAVAWPLLICTLALLAAPAAWRLRQPINPFAHTGRDRSSASQVTP